jgi:tRNA A37 threonylcarbamoyladenosine synthetase subunit TsaC/SUA5/YrdC
MPRTFRAARYGILLAALSTVVSLVGPAPAILRAGDIDPAVVERLSAG